MTGDALAVSRAVLQNASDAIIAADLDDRVTVWNPGAERMFGWAAGEVIGRPLPTVPDDVSAAERRRVRDEVLAGTDASITTRRRHRDGHLLDVQIDVSRLLDPQGRLLGLMGVCRDVTAERAAQRALAERAGLVERLAAIVAGLNADLGLPRMLARISESVAVLLDAAAGAYVLRSGGELRVAAVSGLPEEIVDTTLPVSGSAVAELLRTSRSSLVAPHAAFTSGNPATAGLHERLPTLAVAATRTRGEVTGALYAFFPDVDVRLSRTALDVLELLAGHAGAALAGAAAYDEVRRGHERVQAVIDAAADGMAVVDAAGSVQSWNRAAERLTDLAEAQAVGQPTPFPLGPPGVPVEHQLANHRWLQVLSSPMTGADGLVVTFRDVTRLKELEEAKDLFLATTSHELRTPITVVQGFADVLNSRWDDFTEAERREAVRVIEQRSRAMAGLVEQLLLGSRAGAGALAVSCRPFPLAVTLRSALAGFDALSVRHDVEFDLPEDLPSAVGDPAAVETVVGQLVENAIKYSPDGGTITVSAAAEDGELTVAVADRGVGIAPEERERIFSRFVQLDSGNRRRFGGVGLGLFIVRSLVEAQGGRVRAEGRPGGGTVVIFTLPAERRV